MSWKGLVCLEELGGFGDEPKRKVGLRRICGKTARIYVGNWAMRLAHMYE